MSIPRINRDDYLNKLIAFQDKHIIKVITGVRRCGKSTLMAIFMDHLRAQGVADEQIIAVNFEDFDFYALRDPHALHNYLKERLQSGRMTYIFLDEVQRCEQFPDVVDSLTLRDNVDIYLTGSNATMLSSEIATLLSGRYVEIRMLPLSFKEFVDATNTHGNLPHAYRAYLETSSFPYALELSDQPEEIRDYLDAIYNTIVVKDIAQRHKITDLMMLESVTRFLFDNIGSPLSTKKIADTMTSGGRKIDVKTVEKYLTALTESFIVYQAQRYNIKGKQYLKTLEKYYVVDIGMRYMLLGSRSTDVGHILENIIYLELLRRGYDIYVGKIDTLEVDFVAMNHHGNLYIQVAASVRDAHTLARELAPLEKINDHYPRLILTLDDDPAADYNGIRRENALEWLVQNVQ